MENELQYELDKAFNTRRELSTRLNAIQQVRLLLISYEAHLVETLVLPLNKQEKTEP